MWPARADADYVNFFSSDGYVLEGPRSSVVIATGDSERVRLLTSPKSYPILRGTTQQALFDVAGDSGYECGCEPLTVRDLSAAHGVWLVSSMTLAARVSSWSRSGIIEGVALALSLTACGNKDVGGLVVCLVDCFLGVLRDLLGGIVRFFGRIIGG